MDLIFLMQKNSELSLHENNKNILKNLNISQFKDEDILLKLAFFCQQSELFDQAILIYRSMIQKNPNHTYALMNLGEILMRLENYPEAFFYLKRVIILEDSAPVPVLNRVYLLIAKIHQILNDKQRV